MANWDAGRSPVVVEYDAVKEQRRVAEATLLITFANELYSGGGRGRSLTPQRQGRGSPSTPQTERSGLQQQAGSSKLSKRKRRSGAGEEEPALGGGAAAAALAPPVANRPAKERRRSARVSEGARARSPPVADQQAQTSKRARRAALRRRSSSSPLRGGSPPPEPPVTAAALQAETEVALAAQWVRKRVAFEAKRSRFGDDGLLSLRLTRYEARAVEGDLVEVTETAEDGGGSEVWRGEVADSVGRRCLILPAHIALATEQPRARGRVSAVDVTFSWDAVAQVASAQLRKPEAASGFCVRHLQATAAAAPPPPRAAAPLARRAVGLNFAQAACVADIASGAPLTLCLGPPGTGKTKTVAHAAAALADAGERVVITAPTNVAAVNALRALLALPAGSGGAASVQLRVARSYYIEWHANDYEQALWQHMAVSGEDMDERARAALPPGVPPPPAAAAEARILICTLGMLPALGDEVRPLVTAALVDEAGACWAGGMYWLDHWLPNLACLHLFGADRQLTPSLGGDSRGGGVASLYDAARRCGHAQHRLTHQYRLPSALADFLSAEL